MTELLNRSIDLYCERTRPGMMAEPLNLLTNAVFFVAALVSWKKARARFGKGGSPLSVRVLISLIALTGVGSAVFHGTATLGTMLLDVAPIAGFVLVYASTLMKSIGCSRADRVTGFAAFAGLTALSYALVPADFASDSRGYFSSWIALAATSALMIVRRNSAAGPLLFATATFMIAIVFRSLDAPLCASWPAGTHFLWHVANGLALVAVMVGLMKAINHAPSSSRVAERNS